MTVRRCGTRYLYILHFDIFSCHSRTLSCFLLKKTKQDNDIISDHLKSFTEQKHHPKSRLGDSGSESTFRVVAIVGSPL